MLQYHVLSTIGPDSKSKIRRLGQDLICEKKRDHETRTFIVSFRCGVYLLVMLFASRRRRRRHLS